MSPPAALHLNELINVNTLDLDAIDIDDHIQVVGGVGGVDVVDVVDVVNSVDVVDVVNSVVDVVDSAKTGDVPFG